MGLKQIPELKLDSELYKIYSMLVMELHYYPINNCELLSNYNQTNHLSEKLIGLIQKTQPSRRPHWNSTR